MLHISYRIAFLVASNEARAMFQIRRISDYSCQVAATKDSNTTHTYTNRDRDGLYVLNGRY